MIWRKCNSRLIIAGIICAEVLMSLSDKQGVFFTAAFGMIFSIYVMGGFILPELSLRNRRSMFILAVSSAGVVLFSVIYNGFICPEMIYALNGYYPDFGYQKSQPVTFSVVYNGIKVFLRYISIFGNIGILGGILVFCLITGMFAVPLIKLRAKLSSRRFREQFYFIVTFLLFFSAAAVMFTMMVARHPALGILPELRTSTYIMPTSVILLFFVMLALDKLRLNKVKKIAVKVLLFSLLVINIMTIPRCIELNLKGDLRYYYPRTQHILNIINSNPGDNDFVLLVPGEIKLIKCLRKK
jgi:hypothetical protein